MLPIRYKMILKVSLAAAFMNNSDYSLGKPIGPYGMSDINTSPRIWTIPGTGVCNTNAHGDMSGFTTDGKNE
jgi:hypothetical protein